MNEHLWDVATGSDHALCLSLSYPLRFTLRENGCLTSHAASTRIRIRPVELKSAQSQCVTKGLIGLNEEVTWEARHFGIWQRLTVRVTVFDPPNHFQDIMVSGAFKSMVHDHAFARTRQGTLMKDRFEFKSPLGILGSIIDRIFPCLLYARIHCPPQ